MEKKCHSPGYFEGKQRGIFIIVYYMMSIGYNITYFNYE